MRFSLSALTVVAALALPAIAHADDLTFTTTGSGLDLTFTLPASPTPTGFERGDNFYLGDIQFTENGTMMTADDVYFYNKANAGGGYELTDAYGDAIDGLNFYGPKLYTDGVKHPTFKQGSFTLKGGPACFVTDVAEADESSSCTYGLTIAPAAVTATPEPGSLALLGTGALGVIGVLRRRLGR